MVAKKRKSKRVTLQQKFKVQKRTKEHHKRLKKGRLSGSFKSKQVDNFIPNSWPYKEDLLKEIKDAKERMEAVKQRQKDKRMEEVMNRRMGITKTAETAMQVEESNETQEQEEEREVSRPNLGQNSRRAYLRELRKVVESADVILMVLDARDPIGTRSTAVEEMVLSDHRKKLVYILNKADLVPRDVLKGWLSYLRKVHPTVPFKCNTQNQKGNLGRSSGKVVKQDDAGLQTSQAVGAEELIQLMKNYARIGDGKAIISVGCVGFPNVGKSSLINSLTRTRAVGVSSMPGFTKVLQEVHLDKNIRLIDSPGIVFADGDSTATALRNCVNVEEMVDVITPIQAILDRCPQAYLMQLYSIPKFKNKDAMSFLALVAKNTGRLKKGGIPNIDAAARGVLHDWNTGKIKFYCKPPAQAAINVAAELDTKIVSSFSEALDIDALQNDDMKVLDAIEALKEGDNTYVGMDEIAGKIDFQIGEMTESSLSSTKNNGKRVAMDDDMDVKSTAESSSNKAIKNANAFMPGESAPGMDVRKLQKKLKKKSIKDSRRDQTDYDFEQDFE